MIPIQIKISLFSVLFLFCSCKTIQSIVENNEGYEVIYKSQIGGKKEKSNVIIQNYEDFNILITELKIGEEEYEKLLQIDLEKNNLLVSFMGEKISGGYDIDVQKVVFTDKTAEVTLKEKTPEKNELVTNVITSPYIFVILPKNKTIEIMKTDL